MAGVVDTSVLLACLYEDDLHRKKAQKMVRSHLGIEIPPVILAETEAVIRKRVGLSVAREVLPAFLQANPQVGVLDADLHPEATRIWARHGRLTYADTHAIAAALLLDSELVTLDRRQAAAWRQERGHLEPPHGMPARH